MAFKRMLGMVAAVSVLLFRESFPAAVESGAPESVNSAAESAISADTGDGWGYKYDSLLKDLARWRESPFVRIDSIGASVQGRGIWMVSITDESDSLGAGGSGRKRRVFIHARTHPSEVQANHISNSAIRFLLDSGAQSREIRRGHIFNIIPMYNPDGVELGLARTNSNGVDLEGNWNKAEPEPEVRALRKAFQSLMAGPIPVEVALNLHSDRFNCTRFFFFHAAAGTSEAYTVLEKAYIAGVRKYFSSGIEDWPFVVSWTNGFMPQYPESFWWQGYKEQVMALTYEDANCPNAGLYDSTALALVKGSVDYIRDRTITATAPLAMQRAVRWSPEPGGIRVWNGPGNVWSRWILADVQGRGFSGGTLGPGSVHIPLGQSAGSVPMVLLLSSTDGARRERILVPIFR